MRFAIWTMAPMILLAACAASPPAPSAPAAAAKAPVTAAPAAVATTAGTAAPAATLTSDQVRDVARHAGYQPRTIKGQQYYCRDETPVGTRFPQSVCLTEADLAIRAEINQGVKDQMRTPTSLDPAR
jgi:membrane-bound lytic murein transglycosylase B